jgi:hypothetical protein
MVRRNIEDVNRWRGEKSGGNLIEWKMDIFLGVEAENVVDERDVKFSEIVILND